MKAISTSIVFLACCAMARADVKLSTKYVSSGQASESTVYIQGQRERIEAGPDVVLIQQFDRNRAIQVDPAKRTWQAFPLDGAAPAAKTGGVVTVTTTVTDTGEKKPFFGVAARHLKVVTVQEPSAGACDGAKRRVEIDGWYADFEAPAANLQRTKEIGIRVALGATAGGVSRLVLKQSLRLAAIGSGVGVTLALGLSRLLASELVFMRVFDAAAFSAGVLLVALAAVAAGTCRRGERRVSIQSTRCATTDRPRSYR